MLHTDPAQSRSVPILHVEEVGSTNAEAMKLALGGQPGPFWIRADRQNEGRGRSGRQWMSEPGNLCASFMMRLADPTAKAYQLSLVAGVAVLEAIVAAVRFAPGHVVRLKWPNDILIAAAKAGGILVESSVMPTSTAGPPGLVVVIGIGLNLVSHPDDLGRAATHLGAHCAEPAEMPSADVLLRHIAGAMMRWVDVWRGGEGFAAVRNAWLLSGHPIGERMSINTGAEHIAGAFSGLDAEGALLLRIDGRGERRFTFGDVSLPGHG